MERRARIYDFLLSVLVVAFVFISCQKNQNVDDGEELSTPNSNVISDFGQYHALVVGNNNYLNFPKLKTPINDAQEVTNILRKSYNFKVTQILDGTRSQIITELDKYVKELTSIDNLLIYFAGHGEYRIKEEQGYWLPVDSDKNTTTKWISNSDISVKIKAMEAKHVLIVADSCFSGTIAKGEKGLDFVNKNDPDYYDNLAKKRSRNAFTSGGNEPVADSHGNKNSLFAMAFINSLKSNKSVVRGKEFEIPVSKKVGAYYAQVPQYSEIKLTGHEDGDFIFVRVSDQKEKLKILLYQDETINIDRRIVSLLNQWCETFEFDWGGANDSIPGSVITKSFTFGPSIIKETQEAYRAFICTNKPYFNNYFYWGGDKRRILSFYGWEHLTNLSVNNGLMSFIINHIGYQFEFKTRHWEKNTGCIYDFLALKTGIDLSMRSSYICKEHRKIITASIEQMEPEEAEEAKSKLRDLMKLLDKLGEASKRDEDVVEYHYLNTQEI